MKQTCTRCVMDNANDTYIQFGNDGACNYCTDALSRMPSEYFPNQAGKQKLDSLMAEIKRLGKNRPYDALVGVSGGVDSSYVLLLGKRYGLRMLAMHLDDGLDTQLGSENVTNLCKAAKAEMIAIQPNLDEYRDILLSFLKAGVSNPALVQDNIIVTEMNRAAQQYKIPAILSGANFSTECILQKNTGPNAFDKKHILAIHRMFGTAPLRETKLTGLFSRYIGTRYGQKEKIYYPLNYIDYQLENALQELHDFSGYVYYGGKHHESILTRFMQCEYLPKKYGIDKRKSHLSSLIITGQMARDTALEKLAQPFYPTEEMRQSDLSFLADFLNIPLQELEHLISAPPKSHFDYPVSALNRFAGVARRFRKHLG